MFVTTWVAALVIGASVPAQLPLPVRAVDATACPSPVDHPGGGDAAPLVSVAATGIAEGVLVTWNDPGAADVVVAVEGVLAETGDPVRCTVVVGTPGVQVVGLAAGSPTKVRVAPIAEDDRAGPAVHWVVTPRPPDEEALSPAQLVWCRGRAENREAVRQAAVDLGIAERDLTPDVATPAKESLQIDGSRLADRDWADRADEGFLEACATAAEAYARIAPPNGAWEGLPVPLVTAGLAGALGLGAAPLGARLQRSHERRGERRRRQQLADGLASAGRSAVEAARAMVETRSGETSIETWEQRKRALLSAVAAAVPGTGGAVAELETYLTSCTAPTPGEAEAISRGQPAEDGVAAPRVLAGRIEAAVSELRSPIER